MNRFEKNRIKQPKIGSNPEISWKKTFYANFVPKFSKFPTAKISNGFLFIILKNKIKKLKTSTIWKELVGGGKNVVQSAAEPDNEPVVVDNVQYAFAAEGHRLGRGRRGETSTRRQSQVQSGFGRQGSGEAAQHARLHIAAHQTEQEGQGIARQPAAAPPAAAAPIERWIRRQIGPVRLPRRPLAPIVSYRRTATATERERSLCAASTGRGDDDERPHIVSGRIGRTSIRPRLGNVRQFLRRSDEFPRTSQQQQQQQQQQKSIIRFAVAAQSFVHPRRSVPSPAATSHRYVDTNVRTPLAHPVAVAVAAGSRRLSSSSSAAAAANWTYRFRKIC